LVAHYPRLVAQLLDFVGRFGVFVGDYSDGWTLSGVGCTLAEVERLPAQVL